MENSNQLVPDDNEYSQLLQNIGTALSQGRQDAYVQINQIAVQTNWNIGKYIVEYEQAGHEKAEYGSETLKMLSRDLTNQYGAGFSRSNISRMRQLYLAYPKCATLSHKLSWSHYVELLKIDDPQERSFYLRECEQENWGVRELKRQMKSMLFQRLALSKNKDEVFVSRYQLYLPDREQLENEIRRFIDTEDNHY